MNLPNISALKLGTAFDISRFTSMAAPVGAIAVSVLVLLLIVWPKFTSVLELRSSNQELLGRVQSLDAKAGLLSSLNKVDLTSQVGYGEQLLPSDKAVFSIIRQIETSAGASGVILNKIDVSPGSLDAEDTSVTQPQAPKNPGETQEAAPKVALKISMTSDYNSFLNFMNLIFSLSRVTSIQDLTLSSSSATGETAALRTSMIINAYWKPLPTKLGQIEAPVTALTESEIARLNAVRLNSINQASSSASVVPQVPVGRPDIFAPF